MICKFAYVEYFTRIYSTCIKMDIILQHYKTKVKNQEKEKNLHKKRKITFLFLI